MKTIFFRNSERVYSVSSSSELAEPELQKLAWLLEAEPTGESSLKGVFVGPRKEMITPWSTNATEIALNVGIAGITRIEEFTASDAAGPEIDPMLQADYTELNEHTLEISEQPEPIRLVEDLRAFNAQAGLALSEQEILYLEEAGRSLGRPLTDSEVFAFGQINSEHCRHKIFNGTFVLDGETKEQSLFGLIKETSKRSPENIVSAYKDNVAFIKGPSILEFTPADHHRFALRPVNSVISLKAETHNFPTTVEPFNGASTGTGGEIRDRMAEFTGRSANR